VDIMFLLERLESLIATGTGVPTTRKVLVDKDAILELIDQLRVAVPEEIHAAKRINAEGERIIEKAQDEAERIVARTIGHRWIACERGKGGLAGDAGDGRVEDDVCVRITAPRSLGARSCGSAA